MNNLAFAFSSSAMAFVVGVGTMPQTSTIEPPFDSHQQVNVPTAIAAGQTASSNVEMEIMVMRLIGVDNYRRLQEISQLSQIHMFLDKLLIFQIKLQANETLSHSHHNTYLTAPYIILQSF